MVQSNGFFTEFGFQWQTVKLVTTPEMMREAITDCEKIMLQDGGWLLVASVSLVGDDVALVDLLFVRKIGGGWL